jgi:hypothetical protein
VQENQNRHVRRATTILRRRGYSDTEISEAIGKGGDPLFDSLGVREYLGSISDMTLWRWAGQLGFPGPDFVLGRRRFWRLSTIEGWLARQRSPPSSEEAAA